ncbi:hypothetical protein ACOJQI_12535 [Bacillus salacetis]|uniref:hypothetical protein n=1 Tax=Bacillus salacetis TaxID=2315464 RepID=UPI003BA1C99B
MKIRGFLVIAAALFLLGCTNENKEESLDDYPADTPEEAVKLVSDKEKELKIYGNFQAHDELVLVVFKGFMNKEDIWIAEVEKEDDKWITKKVVLMEEPQKGEDPLIYSDSDKGYEAGYLEEGQTDFESGKNIKVIDLDEDSDRKILLKYIGNTVSS